MKIAVKFLLSFLLLIGAKCERVFACDCIMYPITSYINSSEYIFIAEVKEVHSEEEKAYLGYRATIIVKDVLKGEVVEKQELEFDSADNSNCTFRFRPGNTYLLFAYQKNGKYFVYTCSHSGTLEYSQKNIKAIRKFLRKARKE